MPTQLVYVKDVAYVLETDEDFEKAIQAMQEAKLESAKVLKSPLTRAQIEAGSDEIASFETGRTLTVKL